jgi:2-polyprenyl-6-methoxyphenol hydroxylase-like FAD-dependent oxidoreductase
MRQERFSVEIGILGGGIAGLSVALALRKQGYNPRVYERRTEPATMGAGVTLWPNASFVLEELGLLQDIEAIGGRPLTMRRQDAMGNALGGLDIALLDRTMGYPTYTVLRRHLQEVLLDHAARAGIPVEFGHRAAAIELDAMAEPWPISKMARASARICSLAPTAAWSRWRASLSRVTTHLSIRAS